MKKPGGGQQVRDEWAQAVEMSEEIRQRFDIPFRVGDRVVSRAMHMTLFATVAAIRVGWAGRPYLDLTRFWLTPPQDDLHAEERRGDSLNWFRDPEECEPYVQTGRVYRKPGRAPRPDSSWG